MISRAILFSHSHRDALAGHLDPIHADQHLDLAGVAQLQDQALGVEDGDVVDAEATAAVVRQEADDVGVADDDVVLVAWWWWGVPGAIAS